MSAKVDNPKTAPKTYWPIINRFFNRRKMPAIPPILDDGTLVSNFKIKNELFNSHFSAQCFPVCDKAHRWDNISIRMIQLCGKEIILPLQLLFKSMLEEGIFPDEWRKSNVVPVHKKQSTNFMKNYRPISLLPIFSKVFERLIFNSLYNYLMQNKLFTECQSGFRPGDSCVAQFLSMTQEIYKTHHNCLGHMLIT